MYSVFLVHNLVSWTHICIIFTILDYYNTLIPIFSLILVARAYFLILYNFFEFMQLYTTFLLD